MTIKRTHKLFQKEYLKKNNHLKILDLGCTHVNYWEEANHFADIVDYTKQFSEKNLNFTLLEVDKKLPFKDKEFDFVIASHVAEHVEDISFFLNELSRIAEKGYIEVPTKLEDNLVFENKKAHIWHLLFDDVNNQLNISKKIQFIEPVLTVSTIKKLNDYFRESLVIELFWEDSIEFNIVENNPKISEKISTLNLLKKYFSKKIRSILK